MEDNLTFGVEISEIPATESITEENVESTNIYCPEGYVAIGEEPEGVVDEEHEEYINSGYMTLPDEDPDEDTRTFLYPENYEEVAGLKSVSLHYM